MLGCPTSGDLSGTGSDPTPPEPTPGEPTPKGPTVPLLVNELMASNGGSVVDENGVASDWLELLNAGGEPLDLSGFTVSDDWTDPQQHELPDGLILEPGGHLLLWADGTGEDGRLPFSLDADGESVGVFDADQRSTDWVVLYPPLEPDVAYARLPDGGDEWVQTDVGTPGEVNRAFRAERIDVLAAGSQWAYWDQGTNPGSGWNTAGFDQTLWGVGPAPLGYGDPVATEIGFGPDPSSKYITTWFRASFLLDQGTLDGALSATLGIRVDDGAVIWLDGEELLRINMPPGVIDQWTPAASTAGGAAETAVSELPVELDMLRAGETVIGVEVHQVGPTSSDLGFDLSLGLALLVEVE